MSGKYNSFYDKLAKVGINMPTREEFSAYMDTDEGRRGLHSRLIRDGYLDDDISYEQWGKNLPRLNTTDTSKSFGVMASDAYTNRYTRQAEEQRIDQETKAEEAKDKQIADNYNAMSKLEDTFAAYEQSQDVAELFPGAKSESSTTWRDRVAKRKEGEAQAKAKVEQERKEMRQRMQLLKDNPDAYDELFGIKVKEAPEVGLHLGNSFVNGKPVDKRGNIHDNWVSQAQANQRIDAEDKASQLGFQQQELQDMLADPMTLEKTMREVEAEIERLGKARDVAAQKFSSENPFKAILFSTKGTRSLDPWLEGAYGPEAQSITLELEKAFAKLDNLKNIEKKIKSGELPRGGFWNGVGQMGQAVADKVTDRSWGMYEGMSNMLSESEKQIVFDKIAKGEPLTASEMQWATIDLLEKKANTEVDSPYLYNITSGLMESAPYMRDIFLSPGKGISGAFVNWGKSRYGATGFLKLVGNALQGAATTATVGADELVSGTSERMRGDLSFGENGLEVTGQKSLGRALTQQFASQTASNMVELMGVPLLDKAGKYIGKAVKEVADGLSYGKVSKVLSAMDKSSAVNWVNGVRKSMGIHSLPAEIGEEYVDGFAQSIVEGEDQLSPMLNTEEFLNIAGTCGLMSAIFGSANVAGFAGEFHKVNREYKKAKQEVLRQFSSDVWASLDNLITNAQDEDLTVRLADAMDGMAMNREQRSAIMNYLTALKRYQKFNELNDGGKFIIGGPQQAQATQSTSTSTSTYEIDSDITLKDEIGNPIDAHIVGRDANGNYMVESSQPINGKRVQPLSADQLDAMVIPNTPDGIQQSEVDGYNLTDANQQAEVSMLTDNARESVAILLGVTPDAVDVTLQQVLGGNPTDAKIDARFGGNAQVVKDYMYNVAKTKGMSARLADDIADATAESDRAIDEVSNNGNVVTAKDAEGNDVNVVSGNIVTYEDGQIDVANSDASVVIRHADGTTEMVVPTSLTEVVSMPTEQAKTEQAQAIAQQMQQAFSDRLNGALDYSQGQQYTMLNADGSTTDVTILADNGDGNVTVTARDGNKEGGVTDGKQIVLPKSQIQQGVREFKRNQLRGESAQQTSIPQESQPTEVAEPTQEPSMPTDEQGNILYEQMDADSAWDALLAETGGDADMAMTVANEMIADKTKAVEEASKMVAQPGATPQEKIANLKAVKQAQAQAQAELDAWKAIAETPTRRMSLQAEQAEQTDLQGQQVADKLPTSEEVTTETPNESAPQVGLVEDARTRTLGDKTRKMLDAMAKRLGLQVEFVDEIVTGKDEKGNNTYANADIVGNKVRIAWDKRDQALDFLLGHEFTHRMQNLSPEAYAEFVEATKQALGKEEWNKRINRMKSLYKQHGIAISEQGIIDEVVADYAGELVEERGVFDNFVERNKNNRGLLSKIADVLRSIKEFFTLGKQRKINNAIARLEALIESASEANLRGDVVNMEKDRYSVSSIFEGTGAIVFNEEGGANIDKDGNFYVIINGKQYDGNNLITLDDIKADKRSVLNMMVEDAIKEGNVTEEHADVIMKKYVDIMNMFLIEGLAENGGYANMADKWMWVGETVYKTVQPNSDKQYTKSIDITTVCKKNEAVIRAMSEMQKRVGYGITPAQILDIYIETQQSGYQVPCPVCYVFSRYLRNGKYASGAILGMEQYGEHLPGGSGETWTADQWVAELRRLEEIDEDKANKALYNQASADIVEAETMIDNLGLRLQQSNSEAERKELRKQIEKADARYRAALNIFSQSALTSWIKTFAIQGSDDKGYKMRDDAQYPEDIELFKEHALDLRKAGETQTLFPAIQRLRNSGGSSTGKAVGFESNNALGDVISGIATGNNDTAYARASKATTEKEFQTNRKKATENFKKASKYIKQQTLRGGQRMWSWSDNIEALMPDVVINLMQLELLGGALQTYSKQLEGVNLVARMGGYVNGSLMAKDNGYTEVTEDMIKVEDGKEVLAEDITETIQEPIVGRGIVDRTRVLAQAGSPVIEVDGKKYVLIFDDVIGIDPHGREVDGVHMKGLFDLNKELSKAGNIIVGMNDTHIRVGLADSRIFFIIPWHASGANDHILTQMFRVLGADISSMVSTDYTDMQSEKDYLEKKDGSMPKIEQSVRDVWNAHKNETDWKCGIKGGIDSSKETISESQKHYRELRQAIFDGELINNKAWLREVQADEFLSQVYDRVQSGTIDNSMTKEDNNHIYPYEYWDTSKTYDEADINGERYIEYCRRLGFSPKFSGIHGKKEYKNTGNFTNDKGYWKLLVDRRMYDIHDKFQDLDPVTSEDYTNELVHPGNTNKEFVISEVADAKATNKIVDRVIEKEVARTGTMPTVDYGMSHEDVYKNYKPEYDVLKADEVQAKAETKLAEAKQKLDTLVADGATKGRITTATKNVAKAEEALQQAKKAATSAETEAQKSRFSLTNLTEEEQRIVDEAKANGTYLKAPNGKASNLNERQWIQVRTKAFKDWFGDWENDPENASKVVDENGEPMVVYHNSDNKFTEFNPSKIGSANDLGFYGGGFYFSKDKGYASTYGDNAYEVFLNIRNPFIANSIESSQASIMFNREDDSLESYAGESYNDYKSDIESADGVIHDGPSFYRGGKPIQEYIVAEPTQIKSATDNVGTFDASNPDIRYSLFGGNSGYVGYSMSKRAARAREEGRYPKTDFRKEYGVTAKSFDELVDSKIIASGEWHHTSKFGNETKFYHWDKDYYADIYEENKAVIDKLSRERKTDEIVSLFENHPLAHKAEYDNETERLVDDVNREYNDKIREVENEKRDKERAYNSAVFDALKQLRITKKQKNGSLRFNASNGVGILLHPYLTEMGMDYSNANTEGGKGALRHEARNELQTAIEDVVKQNNIESADATYYTDKVNQLNAERAERVAQLVEAREKEYTTEQTDLNAEVSEGEGQQMRYSLRTKPEPKKTIKVYKLFNVDENGNPQALFIDAANSLEVGVWYDADSPTIKDLEGLETEWSYLLDNEGNVVDKKPLKRGKGGNFVGLPSKADVNKATQEGQRWMTVSTSKSGEKAYHTVGINGAGGVSTYALRPGWHATNVPSARHIGVGKDGANAKYRGANQRWFEIEISADVDYNEEARERYLKAHPTYSREKAYSDLKGDIPERIPEDGYYNFKTNSNANPNQDWYIAGAIKIVRPLTEEEGRKISRSKGIAEDLPYKDGVKNFDDSEVRYSLIGEQGATALDKAEEATHRMDNLAVAREMEADGKDAKAIRMATGWERGADGKWRYEIEDIKLKRVPLHKNENNQIVTTLGEIVEAEELFKAYPQLKELDVVSLHGVNELGQYYGGKIYTFIGLNIKLFKPSTVESLNYRLLVEKEDIFSNEEEMLEFVNKWAEADDKAIENPEFYVLYDYAVSILIHEIQHAIQDFEGFAEGGRSDILGFDTYKRLAGEVESRNAQKRMRMTPEQRRETLLRETEDVAREDQIFLMKNGAQETERKYSLQGGRSIADKYEKKVNTKGKGGAMHLSKFNFMEAWQDEMRALKEVQRIIEQEYGIVLESYEDAYMAENAMSSIAKASWDRYINEVYEPVMRIHDEWIRSGESNESINHYLIAKSGLERNRELMVRDALAEMNKMDAQIINGEYSGTVLRLANALRQGQISQDEYDAQVQEAKTKKAQALEDVKSVQQGRVDAYRAERDALREQLKNGDISYEEFNKLSDEVALKHAKAEEIADYSGLTALAKMYGSKDWQGFAEQMVRDFEAKHSNTDVMWEHINNNTKSAVDYSYKSGVTSKQAKDHLDQMFLWYVPMKGNADVEAEDIYTYVNDKSSSFTPTVKGAKGHSEYVSEDIMALIANTMQSAILQGERNKVKQKFLNMVQNYPTDLFTLDRGWVVMQGNEWVESHPEIKADYTPEQIREAIEKHDAEMQELAEQGLAMSKEGALRLGVPFRATQNEQEHAISVMRNGEKMTIYVNGNPRVTQAINGKLKDTKESLGMRLWHTFTRWLSAGMTGYSIDFTGANLSRDTHHSSAIMFLKYGFKEQIRYILNGFADLPALIRGISGKSGNSKRDAYFQEFLANGGETGYANLRSLDDWKVENKRRIGRLRTMGGRAWGHTRNVLPYIAEAFGYINRLAETSSRFNAYVRARERNQDVATAVSEAKNITVNFNKKGSAKTAGAFGWLANLYRETMMFANPVIQGLYQFLKVGKEHKGRFTVLCLGHVALGGVVPILNQMLFELLGGDEEDEYYNQSEYQRRTNLLIYTGHGYIKIPLAPIFRELYALGDVFYGVIQKKIKMEDGAKDVVGLVRSMFSIEGQSAIDDDWSLVRFILPEQLSVVADISDNVNFMGMPIYKDSDYLRFEPEYKKVYKNAWTPFVEVSAKLNELLGGDEDSAPRGVNDKWLNPAIWQHVVSSLGGGPLKTIGDVLDITDRSGKDLSISNIPVAKRFFMKPDERTLINAVNNDYYKLKEDMAWVEDRVRKLNTKEYSGYAGAAEKLDFMYHSPDYLKYIIFKEGNKEIEELDKEIKTETDEDEIQNLKTMSAIKKDQLISEIEAVDRILKGGEQASEYDSLLSYHISKDIVKKMRKRLKEIQIKEIQNPGTLKAYKKTPEYDLYVDINKSVNAINRIDRDLKDETTYRTPAQTLKLQKERKEQMEALIELVKAYESIGEIKE